MNKRKLGLVDASESHEASTESGRSKRSRATMPAQHPLDMLEVASENSVSEHETLSATRSERSTYRTLSHISICGPSFPRSCYEGWTPPTLATSENKALTELEDADCSASSSPNETEDYIIFRLDEFTVYKGQHNTHSYQLSTLDRLNNRRGIDKLVFDGILSTGDEQRFVQGVAFSTVAVDGYGDAGVTDMGNRVCIQSHAARRENVWYQLGRPSNEYRRFFDPFLWLAQFTKYFFDYLLENDAVTLNRFRRDFYGFLFLRYSMHHNFKSWLETCKLRDFQTTIAAHIGFLWKECHSIDDQETGLLKHPIWGEVDPFQLKAIPRQPQVETRTVVTPFAYECFKHMYFGSHLEARAFSDASTRTVVAKRKRELNLTPLWTGHRTATGPLTPKSMEEEPPLDVSDSLCSVRDVPRLDVIWLYEPKDTTLGETYYPYPNELFFSDNCDCASTSIDLSAVIGKVKVTFFEKDPRACEGLFVRQKVRTKDTTDTYDFVALKKTDFRCDCQDSTSVFENCRRQYEIGDTVLYRQYNTRVGEDRLEPGLIVDFLLEKQRIVLRKLRRCRETDHASKPNQLMVSEEFFNKSASMIIRHCQVRSFHSDIVREGLSVPYNMDGAGDFYFVVTPPGSWRMTTPQSDLQDLASDRLLPFKGWDPDAPSSKVRLTGMGIFCGGGNFDRGLEDGGAVEFKYAVDFAEHALHTYRANSKDPERARLFLGSVDDYLAQAISGSTTELIAKVGSIEVLAAGSPCPGFSRANTRKLDEKALRNSSMVASVVSYVDFYIPRYCLLENVVPMTRGAGPNKDENVFAQILAAFVAMGYQVQQFLMESWTFGSSQSRPRVFIVASTSGVEPLDPPPYTHAHLDLGKPMRSSKLGTSSNGKDFGRRRDDYVPFGHVSALEATKELPNVGDSLPQLCPSHPDHRTPSEQSNLGRVCMAVVPTHPRGMGLFTTIKAAAAQAADGDETSYLSDITGKPRAFFEKLGESKIRNKHNSTIYALISPDRLFPTVLTTLHTNDAFNGRSLHWDQSRTLTVMELKRAQGFFDEEVLIGQPGDQVSIIGNSVDRKVALALGLGLRKSWLDTSPHVEISSTLRLATSSQSTDDESSNERMVRGPGFVLVDRCLDMQTSSSRAQM